MAKWINWLLNEKIGEVVLNLDEIDVTGFETRKKLKKVEDIQRRLENGEETPAVDVVHADKDVYELVCGSRAEYDEDIWIDPNPSYGGHHRAIAHYRSGVPLKCNLFPRHRVLLRKRPRINIRDIHLE